MIMFPGFRKRGLDDWLPGFLGSDTGNFSSCMNIGILNYKVRDQFLQGTPEFERSFFYHHF